MQAFCLKNGKMPKCRYFDSKTAAFLHHIQWFEDIIQIF
jgi:hypothetical protein